MIAGSSTWDQSTCLATAVLLQSVAKHFDGRNLQLYLKQVYFESHLSSESSLTSDSYSTYYHLQCRKIMGCIIEDTVQKESVFCLREFYILHLIKTE